MIQLTGIPYDNNSSFLRGPAAAPARIWLMDREGSANAFAWNRLGIRGQRYGQPAISKLEEKPAHQNTVL